MVLIPCISVLNRNRSRSGGKSALAWAIWAHLFYLIAEIPYTISLIHLLHVKKCSLQGCCESGSQRLPRGVLIIKAKNFSIVMTKSQVSLLWYLILFQAQLNSLQTSHLITARSIFCSINHNFTFLNSLYMSVIICSLVLTQTHKQ